VYQFRLSTLLLAFVVVWSSLAVFGMLGGIPIVAFLLAAAAHIRSAKSTKRAVVHVAVFLLCGFWLLGLLPAVPAVQEATRRIACQDNLKEIGEPLLGLGFLRSFPSGVAGEKRGKAIQSWRVVILPYLQQYAFQFSYDWDEPWNSPKNRKVAASMPRFFCCPSEPPGIGGPMTSYVAVTGPGTVWDDHCPARWPPRATVVEIADSGIECAEPRDLTLDEACRVVSNGSRPRIFSHHTISGGFLFHDEPVVNVLFSDRSVRAIPAGLPPETLRGLFIGDQRAWKECEEDFATVRPRRINWTNCAAVAVLILSYAVMLLRPRETRGQKNGTCPITGE
jgi:hypothetical protein